MKVYALYLTFPSGYVSVRTYPTAFDRALDVILLSAQPVVLRCEDY